MSFKFKSRWLNRTQEAEAETSLSEVQKAVEKLDTALSVGNSSSKDNNGADTAEEVKPQVPKFTEITENIFINEREVFKKTKESKRMLCDCSTSPEERLDGKAACGDECLNRILFIECGPRCVCGEHCTNNRFQKRLYAKVEPFPAGEKGWGLRTTEDLLKGQFVIEYVGEVLNASTFRQRTKRYARDPAHKHHYFMALRNDEVIDATERGNVSRFINHSCNPNSETQKWTVNGQLRIGFFTKRAITAGEEITFDYQFERYGREAQKCLCGSENCRGYIGGQQSQEEKELVKEQIAKERRRRAQLEDMAMEKQLNELVETGALRTREQVLDCCRLMVRGDDLESRMKLLNVLMKTEEPLLRLFLDYHGCWLIWSWMVDEENLDKVSLRKIQKTLLKLLAKLPIPHRNMLEDSRVLRVVKRWAELSTVKSDSADEVRAVVQRLVEAVVSNLSGGDHSPDSSCSSGFSQGEECSADPNQFRSEEDALLETIKHLSQELLSGPWAELKEYFKIPKKTEAAKAARAGRSQREHGPAEADSSSALYSVLTPVGRHSQTTKYNQTYGRTFVANKKHGSSSSSRSQSGSRSPPSRRRGGRSPLLSERNRKEIERNHSSRHHRSPARSSKSPVQAAHAQPLLPVPPGRKRPTRFDRKTPPHLINSKGSTETKAMTVEERRREFELAVATENEEEQKRMMSMEFEMAAAAAMEEEDMVLEETAGRPGEANMVLSPVSSQELDYSFSTPTTTGISDAEGKPQALPALIVADPNTCKYWWQDQASGTLVYPLTEDQIRAVAANDYSVTPNFIYNEENGLIHEVKLQQKAPVAQDPVISSSEANSLHNTSSPASAVAAEPSSASEPTSSKPKSEEMTAQEQILGLQQKIIELEAKIDKQQEKEKKRKRRDSDDSSGEAEEEGAKEKHSKKEKDQPELPEGWKPAYDSEGNVYYYNVETREVQWEIPTLEAEADIPVVPDPPPAPAQKKKPKVKAKSNTSVVESPAKRFHPETTTAAADTSSEVGKKQRETFKTEISNYVIKCLHPYQKPDCKVGKIGSPDDFKHLARKLSHAVMEKELKHTSRMEDLRVTDSVRLKAKDYIKKYMKKLGPVYKRSISASGHASASPEIFD